MNVFRAEREGGKDFHHSIYLLPLQCEYFTAAMCVQKVIIDDSIRDLISGNQGSWHDGPGMSTRPTK